MPKFEREIEIDAPVEEDVGRYRPRHLADSGCQGWAKMPM